MFTQRLAAVLEPFAAPHGLDGYLEQLVPTWSTTEVRARIERAERTTPGTVTLTLRPNALWTGHRAGQHTQLTVEIDGARHTRCFSLAHSAHRHDRRLELTVKAHPEGRVSRHLVDHAEEGTVVGLTRAAGEFTLPDDRPDRILLVSGGSGITPVLSMLRTLHDEGHAGPVGFLHYVAAPGDHVARAEVDHIGRELAAVTIARGYSQDPDAGDVTGRLSPAHLEAVDPRWAEAEAFVCGPAPLLEAVQDAYASVGAAERVHHESFTPPAIDRRADEQGGRLRLRASDVDLVSDGRSVLEQAEDAGLAPAHGCRMGVCHTCVRPVTSGSVRDLTTGSVCEPDGAPVRICVSAPVGDVEVDL